MGRGREGGKEREGKGKGGSGRDRERGGRAGGIGYLSGAPSY